MMQAKGIVKYMNPTLELVAEVQLNTRRLQELGVMSQEAFRQWAEQTNPHWRGYPYCRLGFGDRFRLMKRSLKELLVAVRQCFVSAYRLVRG